MMSELLTPSLQWIIYAFLFGCIIIVFLYARNVNKRLNQTIKLINELYQVSQGQASNIANLTSDLADSSTALNNQEKDMLESKLHSRLNELEQQFIKVENQTQLLQQEDPALKMYHRATQLVAKGASIDDIIEACQLPRAEVEVLISLHSNKARRRTDGA